MKKSNKDPFTMIAIKFLLGVLVGFSMILMGLIFFMIAILTDSDETLKSEAWKWYLATLVFEIVGGSLFYFTLKGSPQPGQLGKSGKIKEDWFKKQI